MKKLRRKGNVTKETMEAYFARHLPYEIDMLRELRPELSSGRYTRLLHNAHVEAFLMHARNLIEFFKNKAPCDFDPRLFTVDSYEPRPTFLDAKLLDKINQQITHLTADRSDVPSEQLGPAEWDRIMDALEGEISRFENALKPDRSPTWRPIRP